MSQKYTLYYFPGRGRAEAARITMAAAGVSWDDQRKTGEDWQTLKPDTPFGQMPVLQVEGKGMIAQSGAIVRYLAREHGMAGETSFEQAKVDQIMGVIDDLISNVVKFMFEKDEDKKKELQEKYDTETAPNMFGRLEKVAGDNGCFVGDGMTVADTMFFTFMHDNFDKLASFPKLKAITDKVKANEGVAAWLAKRPTSQF